MYNITKGELIFILDLAEEQLATGVEVPFDELREVVTIVNGLLDNGDWRTNND